MDRKRIEKAKAEMTLYDHVLMAKALDGNIPAVQKMIDIYLEREDLTVISVECEKTLFTDEVNLKDGRMDVFAEDANGDLINIEIQNEIKDFSPERSRAYEALMTLKLAIKGRDWKEIKETITIVQCAKDPFDRGQAKYVFKRKDEEGNLLNDGSTIMYINGEITDPSTELGRLNHDLKCKNPDEMFYNEIEKSVRPFKEEKENQGNGGEEKMLGRVVEELCEEVRDEGRKQGIAEGKKTGMIDGAITMGKAIGLTNAQIIDSVSKSCNTTKEIVKEYLTKMK